MTTTNQLMTKATEALIAFFTHVIREEIGEDPDHSGPEDAAEELADKLVREGYAELTDGDWKDLLK